MKLRRLLTLLNLIGVGLFAYLGYAVSGKCAAMSFSLINIWSCASGIDIAMLCLACILTMQSPQFGQFLVFLSVGCIYFLLISATRMLPSSSGADFFVPMAVSLLIGFVGSILVRRIR